MPSPINKKSLKRLAELARLELLKREEDKLLKDLQKVLDHFEELKEIETGDTEALTGGTESKNVFREDAAGATNSGRGTELFPDQEDGFLKIPPVFNND